MLPYRLRPPLYGKDLKEKKGKDSFPYRDGGPVERAVKADLRALIPKFEKRLHKFSGCTEIPKKGLVFLEFKDVLFTAKVAMLHRSERGFMLPHCDQNGFSQLLYAVCLDILRDEFTSGHNNLISMAFAVFSLFVLYETNPLLKLPTSSLELLPMGLQHRENPKLLYRRSFRLPIRIDVNHYTLFLELGELARQTIDIPSQIIGNDIAVILGRLLSPGILDLCAYTGPCGLEGLAGHQDYPYATNDAKESTGEAQSNHAQYTNVYSTSTEPTPPFSASLKTSLQNYISKRELIRLPPVKRNMTKHAKRTRETLLPIFGTKEAKPDPVNQLLRAIQGDSAPVVQPRKPLRIRHGLVTFGGRSVLENPHSDVNATSERNVDEREQQSLHSSSSARDTLMDEAMSYELVLPSDVSTELETSIRIAIETLVDRDSTILLRPCDSLTGATHDGVSTLGVGGISTANTIETGVGRRALYSLLETTAANEPLENEKALHPHGDSTGLMALQSLLGQVATGPESLEEHSTGDLFLATALCTADRKGVTLKNDAMTESSQFSDLSSDEEGDEVSVAASRIGQNALQTLLATTGKNKPAERTQRKRKCRKSTSRPTKVARQSSHVNVPKPQSEVATNVDEHERDAGDSNDSDSDDASTGDASRRGRLALTALLGSL